MVKSYRLIASIIRSRGLKGEVQVQSSADLPFYLRPQAELWVVPPPAPSSAPRLTQILSLRGPEQRPWLFLAGVNDRTTATALIGRQLLAASADCQSTSDDQLAIHFQPAGAEASAVANDSGSALGMTVYDQERGLVGQIIEESRATPQRLWTVEGPFGRVLIPAVAAFIIRRDSQNIWMQLPTGLLELNQ